MKLVARIAISLIANVFGLLLAAHFLSGFTLSDDFVRVFSVAALLTIINLVLKPFLKLVLSPVIILTFGLGLIAINLIILKLLDFLSNDLSIQGVIPLLSAALILGVINFVVHAGTRARS